MAQAATFRFGKAGECVTYRSAFVKPGLGRLEDKLTSLV